MQEDEEGFLYPKVNESSCVDCELCVKTCPLAKEKYKVTANHLAVPLAYAAKHKEDGVRSKSTSGGIFTALSDFVLTEGGAVCGAVFNEKNQRIEHAICYTREERDRMRGSKYVQSHIGDIFPRIKELLENDVMVLFTGTPCQCAGLIAFLRNDFTKLFVVDILCHSVPSPLILRETTKRYCDTVENLSFRNKTLGWRNSYEFMIAKKEGGLIKDSGYLSLFFKGLINRPSCHQCKFTNMYRPSDITIGDYWNINKVDATFEDSLGVSSIFVNSEKGQSLMLSISNDIETRQTGLENAMQACTSRQSPMPRGVRNKFWKLYRKKGFDYIYDKYGHYTCWETFRDRTLAPTIRKIGFATLLRKIVKR